MKDHSQNCPKLCEDKIPQSTEDKNLHKKSQCQRTVGLIAFHTGNIIIWFLFKNTANLTKYCSFWPKNCKIVSCDITWRLFYYYMKWKTKNIILPKLPNNYENVIIYSSSDGKYC